PLAASEVNDSTRKYSCTEMANWACGQRLAIAYPAMAGPETPAVTDMKPETAPAPTASDLLLAMGRLRIMKLEASARITMLEMITESSGPSNAAATQAPGSVMSMA